jgi:hypothetical protein
MRMPTRSKGSGSGNRLLGFLAGLRLARSHLLGLLHNIVC